MNDSLIENRTFANPHPWFQKLITINGVLALMMNLVLIYFIVKHSKKSMGTYKYLVLGFAHFDMVYPIVDMVVVPNIHIYKRGFNIFPMGFMRNHWWMGYISLNIYVTTFSLSLALLALHFAYRYILICKSQWMFIFESTKYRVMVFFGWLANGIVFDIACFYPLYGDQAANDYFRDNLMEVYGYDVDTMPTLSSHFFVEDAKGKLHIVWKCTLAIFTTSSVVTFSFIVMVICTIKIRNHLNGSSMSEKSKQLQREMLRALLIQTMIPVVCEYLPCCCCYLCPFLGIPMDEYANYIPIAISFYPLIEPVGIITFIKDYRRAFLSLFSYGRERSSSIQPESSTQQASKPTKPPATN